MKAQNYNRFRWATILIIFINLIGNAQNFNWDYAHEFGMGGRDDGRCVTSDMGCFVYTAGEYEEVLFDSAGNQIVPFIHPDCNDIYIMKYDMNGNRMMSKSLGNSYNGPGSGFSQYKYVRGMTAKVPGIVYITGNFGEGVAQFDPLSAYNYDGGTDFFISRIEENSGQCMWVRTAYQTSSPYAFDASGCAVAMDMCGNAYVIGNFTGSIVFDNVVGVVPSVPPSTVTLTAINQDVFVAKYNMNGDCIWVKQIKGNVIGGWQYGNSIDVDNSGNVYVTGSFMASTTFTNRTLTSRGVDDIFIAKYDQNGNIKWAINEGGHCHNSGMSIYADNAGSIFVTGFFEGSDMFGIKLLKSNGAADIFIAKYNVSGVCANAKSFGNAQDDYGYRIRRYNNRIWLMGAFADQVKIGQFHLTSTMGMEYFLAEFEPTSFTAVYAENLAMTRTGIVEGEDLAITMQGDVYVTGYYTGNAIINPNMLFPSMGGSHDIYFAKLPFSSTKSSVAAEILPSDTNSVSINVFPNPAEDYLYVQTDQVKGQNIKINIYNTTGQLVMSEKIQENLSLISLDIQNLVSGIYQVTLNIDDKIIATHRIVRR